MYPPPITITKMNIDTKFKRVYVQIKLDRNPTLEAYDIYEFKMDLFDNDYSEEFLLFQWSYYMNIKVSGSITASDEIQYLYTLLHI